MALPKLVRDKIPVLHPQHDYEKADGDRLTGLLAEKLVEEALEVLEALHEPRERLVEELADLAEVMFCLVGRLDASQEWVTATVNKAQTLGSFEQGHVLTRMEDA